MHRAARWFSVAFLGLPIVLLAGPSLGAWVGRAPVGAVVALLVGAYALHLTLVRAEDRGWIYYRKGRGSSGALAATSEWLNMYAPSRRHVIEAQREPEWKRDEDDDGDDPSNAENDTKITKAAKGS